MSPIDESYLNTNLIPVDADSTVDEAIGELYRYPPYERTEWYLLVELSDGDFSVVAIADLLEEVDRRGEDLLWMKLSDIPGLLLPTTTLESEGQGIGEARKIMRRSPKQRVLILEGRDAVGVLTEPRLGVVFQEHMSILFPEHELAMAGDPGEEPEPSGRYVNVCLTQEKDHKVVSGETSLAANKEYHLRTDIGPLSSDSVVENPKEFREDLLPASDTGHWLHVVAVSEDFEVQSKRHDVFLPTVGPSWVCVCTPGEEHECLEVERQQYLFIQVKTPSRVEIATMRLNIYYENNLVQSQLLSAEILDTEVEGNGYSSEIDYTLSAQLSDVGFLSPRALNILTNHNLDGTHTLVFKNGLEDVLSFNFTENQISNALQSVRSTMLDIHIKKIVNSVKNRFNKDNKKKKDRFIEDVRNLAAVGWTLWTTLFRDHPDQREKMQSFLQIKEGAIQVSRVKNSLFVFPWAFIYDIPIDLGTEPKLCRLLEEWDEESVKLDEFPQNCPHEGEHSSNTLCPYGFWGMKRVIELPPHMENRNLPTEIKIVGPLDFVFARSVDLDKTLSKKHLENMQEVAGFSGETQDSRENIVDALANPEIELVYFYCHGKREEIGADTPLSYLEVGDGEKIRPTDVITWHVSDWVHQGNHWLTTMPLVFINGCHTTEITPGSLVTFVDAFAGVNAGGVIGTEITLHQRVANEAAEVFFDNFTKEEEKVGVGEALRRMRLHLLRKGNLLGLVYTAYCSADLHLSQ